MEFDLRKNTDTIMCLGRLFFIRKKAIEANEEIVRKLLEELYTQINEN
jgi:hypothetical protein